MLPWGPNLAVVPQFQIISPQCRAPDGRPLNRAFFCPLDQSLPFPSAKSRGGSLVNVGLGIGCRGQSLLELTDAFTPQARTISRGNAAHDC